MVIPTGFEPVAYSLGNCRSILLSYGTIATRKPLADLRHACTLFAIRILTILAMGLAMSLPARAQMPVLCEASGALDAEIGAISEDGIITLRDGLLLSLANIVWPDTLEPDLRRRLSAGLMETLRGQRVQWKAASGPDRWGVTPAFLFVQEPPEAGRIPLPPFWLQAGIVEAGLAPAWPDVPAGACWTTLLAHEATAVVRRRGYWAPRVQNHRLGPIRANPGAHAGRRVVLLWRVASARPWRDLLFLNAAAEGRAGNTRAGLAVSLSERTRNALSTRGVIPGQLEGSRLLTRIIIPAEGLRRARIETADHLQVFIPGNSSAAASQR